MGASLPQHDGNPDARSAELAAARESFRFAYDWPKEVATAAELPAHEGYGVEYVARSLSTYVEIGANLAAVAMEGVRLVSAERDLRERFGSLDPRNLTRHLLTAPRDLAMQVTMQQPQTWSQYRGLFEVWKAPTVTDAYFADDRTLDLAFAWQRVAGCNPMVIQRVDRLPDNFPVDPKRYATVMGNGDTLDAALAEHRAYICDYSMLAGCATGTTDGVQKYLAAPIALFAVDRASKQLRPVAIQCGQAPGGSAPMVSPGEGWRWKMAMALVQMADANAHEGYSHLGRTHMVMEAVKICVERQLAQAHPLYKLLVPHCETTLAINQSAKTSLIAPGGTVDRCFAPKIESFCDVVRESLLSYRLDQTAPGDDFRARGLDDLAALPENPYRDDAGLVWEALYTFVSDYVALYYTTDSDVVADVELQAFVRELGANDGGRLVGVPPANTVAELRFLITRLIWIAGPQHSAVNFSQWPAMGFVPNVTGACFTPTLVEGGPDDEAAYTAMFPPWRIAVEGTTMIYLLSNVRMTTLGEYGLFQFTDLRVHSIVRQFQERLREVESIIEERDQKRLYSYPFLRPSLILQSISI